MTKMDKICLKFHHLILLCCQKPACMIKPCSLPDEPSKDYIRDTPFQLFTTTAEVKSKISCDHVAFPSPFPFKETCISSTLTYKIYRHVIYVGLRLADKLETG